MYLKTKNKMQTVFLLCITLALLFCFGMAIAKPKPVSAEAVQQQLSMGYNNDQLTITVSNGQAGYEYQYWIKKTVDTDDNTDNKVSEQSIWTMVQPYTSSTQKVIDYDSKYQIKGLYNVIVRVKNAGKFIKEIHGVFNLADVNQLTIKDVTVNGDSGEELFLADKDTGSVTVKIFTNITAGVTYSLNCNGTPITAANSNGIFSIDVSGATFKNGFYEIEAVASKGTSTVSKIVKAYVYGGYDESKMPVITDLIGNSSDDGDTTFSMLVKYADGNNIPQANIGNFDYDLKTEGANCNFVSALNNTDPDDDIEDGVLEIKYAADYNNKYGIYRTVGTIKRSGLFEKDDEIIVYYEGYNKRNITLSQTADKYTTAQANQTITITSSASIEGYTGGFYFAYFREDASGWVKIKDYNKTPAENSTFTWTPSRPGIYRIQTRVKAGVTGSAETGWFEAGSYEKEVSKIYTVGDQITGDFSVSLYDYDTNNKYDGDMETGKPYRIVASYTGAAQNVLYMFTVTNANTGLKYLNKYTTSNYIMFTPNKSDTYILSARIISSDNYGYKDISDSITVASNVGAEFVNRNFANAETFPLWSHGAIITEFVAVSDAPENIEALKVTSNTFDNFNNSAISLSKKITDRAIAKGYTHLVFKYYTADPAVITAEGNTTTDNYYPAATSNSWTSMVCDLSKIGDLAIGDVFKIVLGSNPWGSGITYYIADMYFFNANDFDLDTNLATSKALPLWSKGSNLTYFDEVNNAPGGKTAMRIDANIFDSFAKNGIALNEATVDRAISEGYTHLTFKYYTSSPASITAEGNATTDDIYPVAAVNAWTSMTCDLSKIGQLGLGDVFRISIGSSPYGSTSSVYIADMYFFNANNFDLDANLASSAALPLWSYGEKITEFVAVNDAPGGIEAIKVSSDVFDNFTRNAIWLSKNITDRAIANGYTHLVFKYYTADPPEITVTGRDGVYSVGTSNSWTSVECDLSKIEDLGIGDNFKIVLGSHPWGSTISYYISDMYFC